MSGPVFQARSEAAAPASARPDAWSEAEIKDAIANGGKASNNISTINNKATRAGARGMRLFVNPESVSRSTSQAKRKKRAAGGSADRKKRIAWCGRYSGPPIPRAAGTVPLMASLVNGIIRSL
jgi:hypothetical protein